MGNETTPKYLSTAEFAAKCRVQPTTIRSSFFNKGHYLNLKPIKLSSGSLLWLADEVDRVLSGVPQRPSPLLDETQAAEYIGVKKNTLAVWRSTGRYKIPYLKIGASVRYRQADIDAWLDSRTNNSASN